MCHGAEESGAGQREVGALAVGAAGAAFLLEADGVVAAAERQRDGGRGRLHAGNGAQVGDETVVERDLLRIRVARVGQQERRRDDAIGIEAGRRPHQAIEAAEQQSRADQQHDADRGFGDHEEPAQAPLGAAGRRACGRLRARRRVRAHGAERRGEAERERAHDRHRGGEGQHRRVERHLVEAADLDRRPAHERRDRAVGDREAARGADRRQHQALGQQLPDDAAGRGAERLPHRDLRAAAGAAREQQVGEVDARDQQDAADGGEQHQQRAARVADQGVELRRDADAALPVVDRELAGERRLDDVEVGLRRLHRRRRAQASDRLEEVRAALLGYRRVAGVLDARVHGERDPDLRRRKLDRELKGRRHHADNRVRPRVERDRPARDIRRGRELRTPERVADHGNVAARPLVLEAEAAADRRRCAEGREDLRRHDRTDDVHRAGGGDQREAAVAIP